MKKRLLTVAAVAAMSTMMSMTALAAGWQKNDTGWWWQNDDGSWHANGWQWIDSNGDGTAECYYFDANGYMMANTTTPDGYTVNADGAWVQGGVVYTKQVGQSTQPAQTAEVQYNEYGVNVAAMDMMMHSREENSKYGEVAVDDLVSYVQVYYANGLKVRYPGEGSGMLKTVAGVQYDINSGTKTNNPKQLFQYFDPSLSDAEEVIRMLKGHGYEEGFYGAYEYADGDVMIKVGGETIVWSFGVRGPSAWLQ